MNDIFHKDKLIWEHNIRNFEKEFLNMFPDMKLPNYKINFIQEIKNINYSMQVEHTKNPMALNINMGYMCDKNFDYKNVLTHEFTHMNDYYSLLNDRNPKFKSKALSLYTEYHATYIQAQYLFSQNKKSIDCIMQNILESELLIQENIESFNKGKDLSSWNGILYGYKYYFGYVDYYNSICKKYEMKHFDFENDKILYDLYNCLTLHITSDSFWEVCYKIQTLLDKSILYELLQDKK